MQYVGECLDWYYVDCFYVVGEGDFFGFVQEYMVQLIEVVFCLVWCQVYWFVVVIVEVDVGQVVDVFVEYIGDCYGGEQGYDWQGGLLVGEGDGVGVLQQQWCQQDIDEVGVVDGEVVVVFFYYVGDDFGCWQVDGEYFGGEFQGDGQWYSGGVGEYDEGGYVQVVGEVGEQFVEGEVEVVLGVVVVFCQG